MKSNTLLQVRLSL